MNFDDPEHIVLLRRTLERFVEEHMQRPAAAKWDKEDHLPDEVFEKLTALGVMGLTIPTCYGGSGRDILATMVVIEELSRRSLAVAVPFIMTTCYGGMNMLAAGSKEQKAEFLPLLACGKIKFAYGLTEPDVGGDLASVSTRAERTGDKIVVNGAKRFCTGAAVADYIYTLVRSDKNAPRYKNLSLLLIPPTTPGVSMQPMGGTGMRGSGLYDVRFEQVELDASAIVGAEEGWNRGWSLLSGPALDVEKLEVAAMAVGLARGALDDAWQYASERKQFGKPIGAHQAVRHRLVDARTRWEAARLLLYRAATLADTNQPCGVESSMAKLYACEAAQQTALDCQRVMGAYGLVEGFDMERYVRDLLLFPIVGGSSEMQKNNIANRLGLPR